MTTNSTALTRSMYALRGLANLDVMSKYDKGYMNRINTKMAGTQQSDTVMHDDAVLGIGTQFETF